MTKRQQWSTNKEITIYRIDTKTEIIYELRSKDITLDVLV